MKKILISGGSGFVGSSLSKHFIESGYEVYILTRKRKTDENNLHYVQWLSGSGNEQIEQQIPQVDAVINLAGESINGRWNKKKKHAILNSRLKTTKELLALVKKMPIKPSVWVNASAVGFYGTSDSFMFTERINQPGADFLAGVVNEWEEKAREAESIGCRTVLMRFGLILGSNGGVLPRLVLPYRFFAGGTIGTGSQWISWVHINDVVGLMEEVITNKDYSGPVNVTAPHPVTMKEFGQIIADVTKRPHWLPAPAITFRLLLGEMSMLILKGQHVLPETAINKGYHFKFPHLKGALQHLIQ